MASQWKRLFKIACRLIDQVNANGALIPYWTFGGGTALMIQISHRESHDIDLFLDDHQRLGFLDPSKQSYEFEIMPSSYTGDGTGFLKIAFDDIGEIDFIACAQMTDDSEKRCTIEGESVLLETVQEIITKKVWYRGSSITARDIFDIAAASRNHKDEIVSALSEYPAKVQATLAKIATYNAPYIKGIISDLQILPDFEYLKDSAIDICVDVLKEALAHSQKPVLKA